MWHVIYRVTSHLPTGITVRGRSDCVSLSPLLTELGVVTAMLAVGRALGVVTADTVIIDCFVEDPTGAFAHLTLTVPESVTAE